jgi:hypothetical protein
MALIESVAVTEPKNPESGHFHVRICLGISEDYASQALPRLMKWHQASCVDDPKKYEEEMTRSKVEFVPLANSNFFEMKFIGEATQKIKTTWISGLDALHMDDSKRHLIFSEYIRDTVVTRAIVQELHLISTTPQKNENLDHLVGSVEPLLVCLYMHWD